jgi:hypothetical protein
MRIEINGGRMNKRPIIAIILVLLLASLACTINVNVPTIQTVDTKTVSISEPDPKGLDLAKVSLSIPSGTFSLAGGAEGLLQGTIKYNVKDWQPLINNKPGDLSIQQGDVNKITGLPTKELVNDWMIKLTESTPLDLTIQAGAYKGNLDLGGIKLKSLSIMDGASQSTVTFSQPNSVVLDTFSYKTGASQVDLEKLGNANFTALSFDGGAGDYTFDLSGNLRQDATITIKAGVSNITMTIPAGVHAIIDNRGAISNLNTEGTWIVNGSTYEASGEGPVITVNIDVAVGNIKLIHH